MTTKTAKVLARNVKRLRKKQFKSVEEAAEKAGWSVPRWYRLEQGNYPGMVGNVLDELAKLFGVPRSELVESRRRKTKKGKSDDSGSQNNGDART